MPIRHTTSCIRFRRTGRGGGCGSWCVSGCGSYAGLCPARVSYVGLRLARIAYAGLCSARISYVGRCLAWVSYARLCSARISYAGLCSARIPHPGRCSIRTSYVGPCSARTPYPGRRPAPTPREEPPRHRETARRTPSGRPPAPGVDDAHGRTAPGRPRRAPAERRSAHPSAAGRTSAPARPGPVVKIPSAPRRLARTLAAPGARPRTSSTRPCTRHSPELFEQGVPPASTHQTPRRRPPGDEGSSTTGPRCIDHERC